MSHEQTNPVPMPFRPKRALVIGLLGGVASGKSTVARLLARHGLETIDADQEARRVTAQPAVLRQLAERFGAGILAADGTLDRAKLAQQVFGDPQAKAALEALTHPAIREALVRQTEAAIQQGRSVVLDVPLLLEGGLIAGCDVSVFVASSPAARRTRAASRGWSDAEWARREANQTPLETKAAQCEYTLHNDGPLESLERQVVELLAQLAARDWARPTPRTG